MIPLIGLFITVLMFLYFFSSTPTHFIILLFYIFTNLFFSFMIPLIDLMTVFMFLYLSFCFPSSSYHLSQHPSNLPSLIPLFSFRSFTETLFSFFSYFPYCFPSSPSHQSQYPSNHSFPHSSVLLQIIHRDLASRNVLVDHNKVCKIADFGLARSVKDLGSDIYEQKSRVGVQCWILRPKERHLLFAFCLLLTLKIILANTSPPISISS